MSIINNRAGCVAALMAIAAWVLPGSVLANHGEGWYFAPGATYTFFDENGLEDEAGAQISVGKFINPNLSIEGTATITQADIENFSGEADVLGVGANALFFPNLEVFRDVQLFGLIGALIGEVDVNIDPVGPEEDFDAYAIQAGVGLLYQIASNGLSVRAEYKLRNSFIDDLDDSLDHVFFVGLQIPIGHRTQARPEPVIGFEPPPPVTLAPEPGNVEVLEGVNFEFDSDRLTQEARRVLDAVSLKINGNSADYLVKGHTDSQGPDNYNLGLSDRRAKAVRAYLMQQGVLGSRLKAKGYGESQPIASNDSKQGRAKNRRVELQVLESIDCIPPGPKDSVDENGCAVD